VALSNYNQWAERVVAADLTGEGLRLAWTLQRLLLGFNATEDGLGMEQLRKVSRMHGRSVERARAELARACLVEVIPGSSGGGNRTRYRLMLLDGNLRAAAEVSPEENLRAGADVSFAETSAETSAQVTQKPPRGRGDSRVYPRNQWTVFGFDKDGYEQTIPNLGSRRQVEQARDALAAKGFTKLEIVEEAA